MLATTIISGSALFFHGISGLKSIDHDWLIEPGKSVGKVQLGHELTSVLKTLGQPKDVAGKEGEAAMGHIWTRWPGNNGHELDVYTVRGPEDASDTPQNFVRQIRLTSPAFHTEHGLHVGVAIEKFNRFFGPLSLIEKSTKRRLYDDSGSGIAFEFSPRGKGWVCSAITIHPRGKGVQSEYLPYPRDL